MNVNDYVAATRRTLPYRDLTKAEHAAVTAASLFHPTVPIFVVRTTTRECEFVELAGSPYLVYDEYLSETMEMLNHCYLYPRPERERTSVHMAAYRLLAEALYAYDEQLLAEEFASSYHSLSNRLKLSATHNTRTFSGAQACFVILHEIVHFVLRSEGITRVLNIVPATAISRVQEAAELYLSDSFEGQVRPIIHDYGALCGALDGLLGREKDDLSSWGATDHKLVVSLLGKLEIGEECFCDVTAAILSIDLLQPLGFHLNDVLIPAFLAVQYLRLLAEIRASVAAALGVDEDARIYAHFASNVRVANFRRAGRLIFRDDFGPLLADVIDAQTDYEIRIGIPVMEREGLLVGLKSELSALADRSVEIDLASRLRVERFLGFGEITMPPFEMSPKTRPTGVLISSI
jgi:hypothetical protein